MTDLRTEVAELFLAHRQELINTEFALPPFDDIPVDPLSHEKYADKVLALINKRWVNWIEACGLQINNFSTSDYLYDTRRDFTYEPLIPDPNRFSPMSKER